MPYVEWPLFHGINQDPIMSHEKLHDKELFVIFTLIYNFLFPKKLLFKLWMVKERGLLLIQFENALLKRLKKVRENP